MKLHNLDPDDLVTVPKAAELAEVGLRTLWRWIHAGEVPVVRAESRRTMIRVSELKRLPKPEPRGQRAPGYGVLS